MRNARHEDGQVIAEGFITPDNRLKLTSESKARFTPEQIENIKRNIQDSEKTLADILAVGIKNEGDVVRVQMLRSYITRCMSVFTN